MEKQKTLIHNVNTEVTITTPSGLVMFSQMGSNVIIHPDQVGEVIDFLTEIDYENLKSKEVPYRDENGNVVEGIYYNLIEESEPTPAPIENDLSVDEAIGTTGSTENRAPTIDQGIQGLMGVRGIQLPDGEEVNFDEMTDEEDVESFSNEPSIDNPAPENNLENGEHLDAPESIS
jgi:hypothetical protein